jgi:hypothetical protein
MTFKISVYVVLRHEEMRAGIGLRSSFKFKGHLSFFHFFRIDVTILLYN